MAIDWTKLLSQIGTQTFNYLTNPQRLTGLGLVGAGLAQPDEPGSVTEARQFLRNRFTSPTALSQQFTGQVGEFSKQFEPLMTQTRERGIADIQQRFAHAFPKTVGAQGPEFGTLSRYITEEALPREQALLGQLGLEALNAQERAAKTLLETRPGSSLGEQLGQLGGLLALGPSGQQGGVFGTDGASMFGDLGQIGQGMFGTGAGSPVMSALTQAMAAVNGSGDLGPLTQLLASGALAGQPFPIALQAGTPAGQVIQQAINAGLVESPAAQVIGQIGADFGLAGPGLLGPAGFSSGTALASAAGSAVGGGGLGTMVGKALAEAFERGRIGQTSSFQTGAIGAGGGAASGAAIGFAIGGPPGALIGAILGGLGGGIFGTGAEKRRESAQAKAEASAVNAARPQAVAQALDMQADLRTITANLQSRLESGARAGVLDERTWTSLPDGWFQSPFPAPTPGAERIGSAVPLPHIAIAQIGDAVGRLEDWIHRTTPGAQALGQTMEIGQFESVQRLIKEQTAYAQALAQKVDAWLRSQGI